MLASRRNFVIYSKDIRQAKSKLTASAPTVKKYLPTVDTSAARDTSEHTHTLTHRNWHIQYKNENAKSIFFYLYEIIMKL